MLGIAGKLLVPFVTLCKKIQKNLKFTAQGLPKTQLTIIWLIGILRIKMEFSEAMNVTLKALITSFETKET